MLQDVSLTIRMRCDFASVWFCLKLPKAGFPLGGILRAERNFSLSYDFSGGTNWKLTKNWLNAWELRTI